MSIALCLVCSIIQRLLSKIIIIIIQRLNVIGVIYTLFYFKKKIVVSEYCIFIISIIIFVPYSLLNLIIYPLLLPAFTSSSSTLLFLPTLSLSSIQIFIIVKDLGKEKRHTPQGTLLSFLVLK